uniref:Uncharacterized protein n=1 Tax=Romanomermis culicivorax TaxID=13658 RepID=A0A915IDH4_ROMCU
MYSSRKTKLPKITRLHIIQNYLPNVQSALFTDARKAALGIGSGGERAHRRSTFGVDGMNTGEKVNDAAEYRGVEIIFNIAAGYDYIKLASVYVTAYTSSMLLKIRKITFLYVQRNVFQKTFGIRIEDYNGLVTAVTLHSLVIQKI